MRKAVRDAITRGRKFLVQTGELWLAAAVLAAGVYFFSGYFTTIRFDRERIEVQVARGRIQVRCLYHFTNASRLPAVVTLRVPFPVDRDHLQPEVLTLCEAAEDGRELAEIPLLMRGGDVAFRLIFRPRQEKWIRVDYAQGTRVANGRYILTTTRTWRRPIERADYVLRLPRNFELASSNYPVSLAPAPGPWKVYSFSKSNFYPGQDWEFVWDEPPARAAIRKGERP